MNPFQITETYDLIRTVEQIKNPASYLLDIFFPNKETLMTDTLPVESMKEGRRLAPFVSKGARALNMSRAGSTVRMYKCPCIGARRTISIEDISLRSFGETPIFSTKTPAQRAAAMQARDLTDLMQMLQNRRAAMAAELLFQGKITVKAYADDGKVPEISTIDYDMTGAIPRDWTQANATIFKDLQDVSEQIQELTGTIPTLMICGKNVEKYMRDNDEMSKWLFSANVNAINFINYQPRYFSPQVRTLGYISALNLEVVSYLETYEEDGQIKSFVPEDMVLIGVPGRGRQVFGLVSYLEQSGDWNSAAAENVPIYNFDATAQQTNLTVYSRFLPILEDVDDVRCLKVATPSNLKSKAKGLPAL